MNNSSLNNKGVVIWFTGIPSSGKSTIGGEVLKRLQERNLKVENLDADEVRANLSPDLKWSKEDRDLNTKRLTYMAHLLERNGVCSIIAAVASLREFRDRARRMIDHFVEVWVNCPVEVCQERDPKGLYKRAQRGEVNDIAGLHQVYEEPLRPEVVVETHLETLEECVDKVMKKLEELCYIPQAPALESVASQVTAPVYEHVSETKIEQRLHELGYL